MRTCDEGDGTICSKNRKIVPYHRDSPNRPLSHGGHFESQENKKLCFYTASLALDERLDVQNLLFQHCVIKVYTRNRARSPSPIMAPGVTLCFFSFPSFLMVKAVWSIWLEK